MHTHTHACTHTHTQTHTHTDKLTDYNDTTKQMWNKTNVEQNKRAFLFAIYFISFKEPCYLFSVLDKVKLYLFITSEPQSES